MLVALALATTVLRSWIRLCLERRQLTIPDYLVWGGWFSTLGFFICSGIALYIQIDHPLVGPYLMTDSVAYLKVSDSIFAIKVTTDVALPDRVYLVLLLRLWPLLPESLTCGVLLVANSTWFPASSNRRLHQRCVRSVRLCRDGPDGYIMVSAHIK